jgi:hypothetical protein
MEKAPLGPSGESVYASRSNLELIVVVHTDSVVGSGTYLAKANGGTRRPPIVFENRSKAQNPAVFQVETWFETGVLTLEIRVGPSHGLRRRQ